MIPSPPITTKIWLRPRYEPRNDVDKSIAWWLRHTLYITIHPHYKAATQFNLQSPTTGSTSQEMVARNRLQVHPGTHSILAVSRIMYYSNDILWSQYSSVSRKMMPSTIGESLFSAVIISLNAPQTMHQFLTRRFNVRPPILFSLDIQIQLCELKLLRSTHWNRSLLNIRYSLANNVSISIGCSVGKWNHNTWGY